MEQNKIEKLKEIRIYVIKGLPGQGARRILGIL